MAACCAFSTASLRVAETSGQGQSPPARSGSYQCPVRFRSHRQQTFTLTTRDKQQRVTARLSPATTVMVASAAVASSVSGRMADLKKQGKCAFIPFITAGDPSLDITAKALQILDKAGADIIELGVPYSDPLADGPVIQAAATRALEAQTTLDKVLAMLREVSPSLTAPVIMFTYYNPIMARGSDRFCQQAKDAGASGLLVPDLPLEETVDVRASAEKAGLELVLLTTPTTPLDRMTAIAQATQGFLYLVSVTGVTGQRVSMEGRVEGLISQLHELTDKPVCVGFGVSGADQAEQLVKWGADGVIVGSALVKKLGEAASPEEGLQAIDQLARSIKAALS